MGDIKNPKEILHFWFDEIKPEQRFKKDPAFDQRLRNDFLETHQSITKKEKEDWKQTPEGILAYIIVLDQFSRNMFREKPESFASDEQALSATIEGLAKGFEKEIEEARLSFFYMPMMHSENSEVHKKALPIFESLGEAMARYEVLHKKIIDRFGRYPHRNKILGRESTPEEIEFLKEENSSF